MAPSRSKRLRPVRGQPELFTPAAAPDELVLCASDLGFTERKRDGDDLVEHRHDYTWACCVRCGEVRLLPWEDLPRSICIMTSRCDGRMKATGDCQVFPRCPEPESQ